MAWNIRDVWNGLKTAAPYVATAYGIYQGNRAQGKADDLNQRRIDMEERAYNDAAPLRSAGMAGMLRGGHDYDLSNVSYDQTNPFARRANLPSRQSAPPAMSGPPTINGEVLDQPFRPPSNPLKGGDQSMYQHARPADPSQWEKDPVTGRWRHK